MLKHSLEIVNNLEGYLKSQCIAHQTRDRVGILTFSAAAEWGGEPYAHHINVSVRDFWITVQVPVEVPRTDKVITRLAKFCSRVNLDDNTGGFLVLDYPEGRLLYRMRVDCMEDRYGMIESRLPLPARMVNHYMKVIPLLIQGKSSVEEAVKVLDRSCPVYGTPRLVPPRPKQERQDEILLEERKRLLRKAIEDYLREKQNQSENP